MMHFFAFVAACIFAVELYANGQNSEGVIAWIHLTVIGSLEVFLLGYLLVAAARWMRRGSNPPRDHSKKRTWMKTLGG